MTIYHFARIEKPEGIYSVSNLERIDMENVDYKRQPDIEAIAGQIENSGGMNCGILRGGMFGLATNQIWVFSAWGHADASNAFINSIESDFDNNLIEQGQLKATVRPTHTEKISREGIYVIRWISMNSLDIDEYTQLCLETWPRFEASAQARCYGVFRPIEDQPKSTILMLTWYATMDDWEKSRQLDPGDKTKWARRSEMELSHWAEVGRLA